MFHKDCQGIVTSVNPVYCYFELNNSIKVYMSKYLSQTNLKALPGINVNVTIKNARANGFDYVVCNCSNFTGNLTEPIKMPSLIGLVKQLNLGAADILMLHKVLKLVDDNFTYNIHFKLTLLLLICDCVKTVSSCVDECGCLNKVLGALDIVTVNSCRRVEIITNKYNKFPHWSFGVHSKPKENTMIFGYLVIEKMYGFLMLKDAKYQMPCIIYEASSKEIESLVCSHVLIKSYKIITEIFRENVPNLEYLLVEFDDIVKLHQTTPTIGNLSFNMDISRYIEFKFNMHFMVVRKSMPCLGNSGKPEVWIQILIYKDTFDHTETAFLILPSQFVELLVYFKEFQDYKLFHDTELKETSNLVLSKLVNCKILELVDKKVHFEVLDKSEGTTKFLSVGECKRYVCTNADLVSFKGVLTTKRFPNTLPARTKKRSTIYGFGTPGSKTHQLVFKSLENDETLYLDCYLSDWENILMPLGLIPQMLVAVKNVRPQSKKYLKSTALTSFEIISYEPVVDFYTVNLYEFDDIDWGPRFFLGHGNEIPYDVLVWGKVLDVEVLSVKICTKCKNCQKPMVPPDVCSSCGCADKELDFILIMCASDEMGQSKIMVKEINFLKALLHIHEQQFPIWLTQFALIGNFQFNIFEEEEEKCCINSLDIFKSVLRDYFRVLNTRVITRLNLKCRKLDSNPEKNGGRPLWFCIEATRC